MKQKPNRVYFVKTMSSDYRDALEQERQGLVSLKDGALGFVMVTVLNNSTK